MYTIRTTLLVRTINDKGGETMFSKEKHLLSVALRLANEGKLTKVSAKILSRAFNRHILETPRFVKYMARG